MPFRSFCRYARGIWQGGGPLCSRGFCLLGRADDVIKQLLPLFQSEAKEAREATYRQTKRIEMLALLGRAGIACANWSAVTLCLLRSLEEMKAGGDAAQAVRFAALAIGEAVEKGEVSLRHFEVAPRAFTRVVLLLGDVLRLDKFDKDTQVEVRRTDLLSLE